MELTGYHVEVKSGRQIPKAVIGWLETLRQLAADELAASANEDVIPLLILQPFHMKEQIVVMTLSDFSKLAEAAKGNTYPVD